MGLFRRAPSPLDLNLLPPGRHGAAAAQRAVLALLGLVALALMAYLLIVAREAQQLRTRLMALDEQLETAYQEHAATVQARREELERLQARAQGPATGQATAPPQGGWAALMVALSPQQTGVELASLSISGGQLRVIGTSQERAGIDAYVARLQGTGLFGALEPVAVDESPDAYQFSLQGTLIEGLQ